MSKLSHTPLTNIELCYDGVHTPLTRTLIADLPKDEFGNWQHSVKDQAERILSIEQFTGFWFKYTRDSFDNELTFENSSGYWYKYTRDSEGNVLSYEHSDGNWFKYTRDSEGNLLTREDEDGLITYLADDEQYDLYYQDGLYKAGCRNFTYEEAIEHWTERAKSDIKIVKARAIKFLAAIQKHHQGLNNDTTDSHTSHQY